MGHIGAAGVATRITCSRCHSLVATAAPAFSEASRVSSFRGRCGGEDGREEGDGVLRSIDRGQHGV